MQNLPPKDVVDAMSARLRSLEALLAAEAPKRRMQNLSPELSDLRWYRIKTEAARKAAETEWRYIPQLLFDPESRLLLRLVGGLALIYGFEEKALRRRTTRQIQEGCERFGFGMSTDTVRPWMRAAVAYAKCPERPLCFPTKAKGTFPTKVKGTLRMLIQGMIADHFAFFRRPLTDDALREILNDLDGVGVKMDPADLREALHKIDVELGEPKSVY